MPTVVREWVLVREQRIAQRLPKSPGRQRLPLTRGNRAEYRARHRSRVSIGTSTGSTASLNGFPQCKICLRYKAELPSPSLDDVLACHTLGAWSRTAEQLPCKDWFGRGFNKREVFERDSVRRRTLENSVPNDSWRIMVKSSLLLVPADAP
jgi:hypothetical protein